jgi:probable O-glycosylation ligase (exosortase A-associated)
MKGLLFTYLMTYGGSVVALFNPFYGLLIYVCFSIIRPEALWFYSVPHGNYSRTVAIALLIGWTLRGFGNWDFGRAKLVVYSLLAYFGWSVIGAAFSPNTDVGFTFVENLAKIVLPFLVGITTVESLKQVRQLAWTIALSQGFVAYEMNMSYFGGFNQIQELGFGGMDNNSIAISIVTCLGLAFFLGLGTTSLTAKAAAYAATAFMGHAILLTFSRGAMLATIAFGLATFWLIPKQPKTLLLFAVIAATGASLAGPALLNRYASTFAGEEERDSSAQSRLDLWRDCTDVALKNPILGCGPDHWVLIAHTYGWPRGKEAHSLWFQQWAEQGFIGIFILLMFYATCLWRLWPLTRAAHFVADPWATVGARMIFAALCGFFVSSQFVSLEGLETPYYVVLIGCCLLRLDSLQAALPAPWLMAEAQYPPYSAYAHASHAL